MFTDILILGCRPGGSQGGLRIAREWVPDGGPPYVDGVVGEALLEIAVELLFLARLTNTGPRRLKGHGRLVLNSPVIQMKWEQPSTGTSVPGPNTA